MLSATSSNSIASTESSTSFDGDVQVNTAIDTNGNGEIEVSEALAIKYLSFSFNVSNVAGLEFFTNLEYLNCGHNNINNLDVSGFNNLKHLFCQNNNLTSITVTNLTHLQRLDCGENAITSLDVSNLSDLNYLYCRFNQLTTLNLTGSSNIVQFNCGLNQLTTLDLTGLVNLYSIHCYKNHLTTLDLSGSPNLSWLDCSFNYSIASINVAGLQYLTYLDCSRNQLTSLNLEDSINLETAKCNNNLLISLNIKNGSNEFLNLTNNPSLEYICADDSQITSIQNALTNFGYANCHVNSYCSFTPGGTFYTIQGNSKYDENNNGCDIADINFPNLKFSFNDGTNTGNLISDESGAYRYDVQYGTHTVTPILENPAYFVVSPTTATVTFPTQSSPFQQVFCVSAVGTHDDLEVVVVPTNSARAGFDVNYKIIYKNKGNHTQSGSVNLAYDDTVLDLVSVNPSFNSSSTNNLSWSFSNLHPFETREITLTMNLNSPTETPPLTNGSILNYTATIAGSTDETPDNNVSTLNQTVFNSLDPNDKTCLEGNTVSPSMIGHYVHYVIRFENTGSVNAENIVVKDMIDATKYDIDSLVPLSGSASYVTRITNTNKVEFIFENINLPFDDANNDGYVAFKIKTKSNLVVGDTFSNSSSIYFDYNFPIVTNTATTTIQVLAVQDFEFNNYVTISPNPAKNELNFQTKNEIQLSSLSIYNTMGQLVLVITEPDNSIDVASLKTGSYFIKIISDKGTSSSKFIKE